MTLKKGKKAFLAVIGFAGMVFITACGKIKDNTPLLYNSRDEGQICVGGGYLYNQTETPIKMRCLKDGKIYDFVRDPFFEEGEDFSAIRRIFPGEDFLYYYEDMGTGVFRIMQRDYETFSEKTVYEKEYWKFQRELFLGITKSTPYMEYDFLSDTTPSDFCVFEDVLFLFYNNRVECMDKKTKKISMLCERGCEVGNYAYYQGKLYFIGNDFSLYSYDIAKDKLEAFEGMKARRFLITPEGIFYANANDAWKLYFMDFNGEGKRKLADMAISSMDFDGERLYYVSVMESGRPIYSMAPDGSDVQIVFELPEAYALSYIEEEQTLYVSYRDSEGKRALYSYELSEETR